jgi:tetratricopeptide (TPR) repeat protein
LLKAATIVAYVLLFWTSAVFTADPTTMIIFPLDATPSEATLAWLSEGIATSIGEQLGSRNLKVIGRNERIRLVESIDLPPGARLSRGSMIRVAQRAGADLLVTGEFSGTERNLRVALRVLEIKTLRPSGEMTANGPISAMPQMENELAWMILSNVGLEKEGTREDFQLRMRKVPNSAYAYFIQSFVSPNKSNQIQLLKKAVGAYRDFPGAQFQLGQLFFYDKDCANALPHLALGRIEGSNNLESEFMRGTCYVLIDQPTQAIQSLSQVLSSSRSFEVLNNIGVAYLRRGDTALALNALLEAKNLAHTDSTISINLAIARHLQGNDLAARSVVEEAIKSHPKNGMLQFLLSYFLKGQGESEKATAAAGKAKSLGINVEQLQVEDPRAWARIISNWEN